MPNTSWKKVKSGAIHTLGDSTTHLYILGSHKNKVAPIMFPLSSAALCGLLVGASQWEALLFFKR